VPQNMEIARLLRANSAGFVAGCRVDQLDAPAFGALVRAPLGTGLQAFGLVHDVRIDDDGLVRQLVTAERVSQEVLRDNRERRIIPIEVSVTTVGFEQAGEIHHLLPPRPPLSLDALYLCEDRDLVRFTSTGHFGYFRHVLRNEEAPIGEVLAAHLRQADAAHDDGGIWRASAVRELIGLLRDDYPTLMSVLSALNEVA
jgi:hypothetical protein